MFAEDQEEPWRCCQGAFHKYHHKRNVKVPYSCVHCGHKRCANCEVVPGLPKGPLQRDRAQGGEHLPRFQFPRIHDNVTKHAEEEAEIRRRQYSSRIPTKDVERRTPNRDARIPPSTPFYGRPTKELVGARGPGGPQRPHDINDVVVSILATDLELRPLWEKAFRRMDRKGWQGGLCGLLESYCESLCKDAAVDWEDATVPHLLSECHCLAVFHGLRGVFGSESRQERRLALVQNTGRHKLPLLERGLHTLRDGSARTARSSFDSAIDVADKEEETEFPKVKQLTEFLASGQAIEDLRASVRRFVNTRRTNTRLGDTQAHGIEITETGSFDRVEVADGPPDQASDDSASDCVGKECRDQTICRETFREDVIEQCPGDAADLVRASTMNDGTPDLEKQEPLPREADASHSATPNSSNLTSSKKRSSSSKSSEPSPATVPGCSDPEFGADERGKWVLLCLPGRASDEVRHANMKNVMCNRSMYTELNQCYLSGVRWWIRWLTLHKLGSIDFVRFHVYWRNNVNIESLDYGSLPPPHATDYELDRTVRPPPILRTALAHYIQHPTHAPLGVTHLKRMPKKVGARVTKDQHGKNDQSEEELEGWGLHVRETVCWKKVQVAMAVIGSGSLIFAIVWCVRRGGGLQDGFTVAGVLMAYGTILLGLVHGAALSQWQTHASSPPTS
ncbi:MAG: hypothetical protein M1817_000490 [Caeruleum heppii]|nr:MAG: hypothetical protein M1817_000490 [Caeruleum heppii]